MPGLTVTEKEHWIERITKKIDKRIEAVSAEDPSLKERIDRELRERALASLGLAEVHAELEAVKQQLEAGKNRMLQIERAMLAQIRGVAVEEVSNSTYYSYEQELSTVINRRKAVHEDELLADCEIGRQILGLRQERDNLLDTVWLASSPKQIKELWSKVATLLGDEQTPLQRDALAIEPIED